MDTLLIAADANAKQVPNMELAQLVFSYTHYMTIDPAKSQSCRQQILDIVKNDSMAPFYKSICAQMGWAFDQSLYDTMR